MDAAFTDAYDPKLAGAIFPIRAVVEAMNADVVEFAAARKFEETTVARARLCNVSVGAAERAMMQERPEMILIIVKAAGLAWGDAKAILGLRSRTLAITPFDIERCLASFERLSLATAQRIIQFYWNWGDLADKSS